MDQEAVEFVNVVGIALASSSCWVRTWRMDARYATTGTDSVRERYKRCIGKINENVEWVR